MDHEGTENGTPDEHVDQPDENASSDGDGSWTEDPITADPDEDRSVDAVIARTSGKPARTTNSQGDA